MSTLRIGVRASYIALVLSSSLMLCGCLSFGGGDTTVVQGSTTVSKGQELTDLQRALSEGAINQGEYDDLRSKILRRPK